MCKIDSTILFAYHFKRKLLFELTMFTRSCILLLVVVSICYGQFDKQPCAPDTVDFATKVEKSSIVVYGKAMSKALYEGNDSMFHVFYQVDCVLKGPATLRQINITNAGKINLVHIHRRNDLFLRSCRRKKILSRISLYN